MALASFRRRFTPRRVGRIVRRRRPVGDSSLRMLETQRSNELIRRELTRLGGR